jgi:hypothetical protein
VLELTSVFYALAQRLRPEVRTNKCVVLKVRTGKELLLNRVQGIMRPYVWAGVLRLSKLKVVLNDG